MNPDVLAIDLGKTGCRAALWTGGHRAEAEGAGAPGLASPRGAGLAAAAIMAVSAPLLRAAGLDRVDAVAAGVAGMLAAPAAARDLARQLCATLPARSVAVASDAATSHAGALGGGPGVALAVGTGAVAIAVGPDGAMVRSDGWGPWLGDEGGGAWLGLQGLRAVLRAHDRRGPATALAQAAATRFGAITGLAALLEGSGNPPRLAAAFAGDVAGAAQAGDAVASALLQRAVTALAATVAASASRLPRQPMPFAMVGGLLGLGPGLTGPLLAAVRAGAPWLEPVAASGASLDGAFLLATDRGTLHEPALVREQREGVPYEDLR